MKLAAGILSSPARYRFTARAAMWILRRFPRLAENKKFNPWYKQREMPAIPEQSFREWYQKNRK